MVIRICYRVGQGEWIWKLENERGNAVCVGSNSCSLYGGYTRKTGAVKAAWRFVDRNFDSNIRIKMYLSFTGILIGDRN